MWQVSTVKLKMSALQFWRPLCWQLDTELTTSCETVSVENTHRILRCCCVCALSIWKLHWWSCPSLPSQTFGGGFYWLQCGTCLWGMFWNSEHPKLLFSIFYNETVHGNMPCPVLSCPILDNTGAEKLDFFEPSCPGHPSYHFLLLHWPGWASLFQI